MFYSTVTAFSGIGTGFAYQVTAAGPENVTSLDNMHADHFEAIC